MTIRTMTINDYDSVYSIWCSCSGMGLNNLDDSEAGIEKFLSRNPETCFVAVENSCTVGVIMAGHDGRRGYIYHTAVAPEFRKQGIATALVENAVNALKSCGINKVALVVFERNDAGNKFWEKLGFNVRSDLVYRDLPIAEIIRMDT